MDIQHQCLIRACLNGLIQRHHFVQFAVTVELGVERIRRRAANRGSEQADALLKTFGIDAFVLGDDDNGWSALGQARVLRGRSLDAARNHQAHMHVVMHIVGADRFVECLCEFLRHHADVESNGFRSLIEPREMLVEPDQNIMMKAQSFPHAIPHQKAAVKNRDFGIVARDEFAVDIYQYVLIPFIRHCIVGAAIHLTHRVQHLRKGGADDFDNAVDLCVGDDERRTDGDGIKENTSVEPFVE